MSRRAPSVLILLLLGACATTGPERPSDPREAARQAMDEGRVADVASLLGPLVQAGEASADDLVVLAESWLRRGDGGRAYEAAADALQKNPDHVRAHEIAGQAAYLLGQHAVALDHLQPVGSLPDASAETLGLLARVTLEVGTSKAAVVAAKQAVDAGGGAEALILLAQALTRAGDTGGAEAALVKAIELAPEDAAARYTLGNLLAATGELARAEASYREALELNPVLVDAMRNLGSVLVMQDKAGEAINVLERASRIAPDGPEIQNNLGVAFARQGKDEQAAAAFEKAVALAPGQPSIRTNAADALAQMGRLDDAIALLSAAPGVEVRSALARLTVARAMARAHCAGRTDRDALRASVSNDLAAAGFEPSETRATIEAVLADPHVLMAIDRATELCTPGY